MLAWLTWLIIACSAALTLWAGVQALRDRLINDAMLLLATVIFLGLVVQLVVVLARVGSLRAEGATFAAYGLSLPFVLPFVVYLAIKEKTRWAMAALAVAATTVAVMTWRVHQIWGLYGS